MQLKGEGADCFSCNVFRRVNFLDFHKKIFVNPLFIYLFILVDKKSKYKNFLNVLLLQRRKNMEGEIFNDEKSRNIPSFQSCNDRERFLLQKTLKNIIRKIINEFF